MRIAIIGAGRVGTALGNQLLTAGHDLRIGSRDPGRATNEPRGLNVPVLPLSEAASWAEIVLLSVPWTGLRETVTGLGDLNGKIVIDATNPVALGQPDVELPSALGFASGAEAIAAWAPSANVVKAFNTTGAANLARPEIGGHKLPALICGAPDPSKIVAEIATSIGFEPVIVGGLDHAHLAEAAALLWITLAYQRGFGPDFSFVIARR